MGVVGVVVVGFGRCEVCEVGEVGWVMGLVVSEASEMCMGFRLRMCGGLIQDGLSCEVVAIEVDRNSV